MKCSHDMLRGLGLTAATRWRAIALLAALLLIAAAGCGSNRSERSADGATASSSDGSRGSGTHGGDGRDTDADHGGGAAAGGAAGARATGSDGGSSRSTSGSAGSGNHVRIHDKGCLQFEPRWAEITVGTSITWTSEAKEPVTIHFPSGLFSRTEFTVPPGRTLSSGPALKSGTYPLWTNPSSCQDVPLGVRGSGPGVAVEEAGGD